MHGSPIILYITLVACAAVIATAVRRYDLHTREPWWTLVVATGLGFVFMWLAGEVQLAIIHGVHARGNLISDPALAISAGVTEELGKLLAALGVLLIARKHFDEPLDGLIYGSFAGLGAAINESVVLLRAQPELTMLPAGEIVRLLGHLVMGGIGCYGVGAFVSRWPRAWAWFAGCLIGSMVLHTLWDVVAFDAQQRFRGGQSPHWGHAALSITLMLSGLIAFRWLVAVGARRSGVPRGVTIVPEM